MGLGAWLMLSLVVWQKPDLAQPLHPYCNAAYFIMTLGVFAAQTTGRARPVNRQGADWSGAMTVLLCGAAVVIAIWWSALPARIFVMIAVAVVTLMLAAGAAWFAWRHRGEIGELRFETNRPPE